jgi:excisionase family DNA binding protein
MARVFDIVEAPDQGAREMVSRVPAQGSGDFRIGSQVICRESQAAVFFRDGKALDTFGAGRHTITTANIPLLAGLLGKLFSGKSPFTAEVYFVNQRDFTDMKWGTAQPIALRDKDLGLVQLRANGAYSMVIAEPQRFVTQIVGTQGLYRTPDIESFLRTMVVSRLTDLLGETKAGLFDLPALFSEMSAAIKAKLADDFEAIGIQIKQFFLQSISPSEETQKAIDERAAIGAIGDMQRYMQYKAAQAMGTAAAAGGEAGGAAATGVGFGAGIGLGTGMAGMISQAMQGAGQAGAAAAAIPDVMSLAEAAAYLKVGEADVQALIDGGQIKAKQIGAQFRISKKVIDEYLAG